MLVWFFLSCVLHPARWGCSCRNLWRPKLCVNPVEHLSIYVVICSCHAISTSSTCQLHCSVSSSPDAYDLIDPLKAVQNCKHLASNSKHGPGFEMDTVVLCRGLCRSTVQRQCKQSPTCWSWSPRASTKALGCASFWLTSSYLLRYSVPFLGAVTFINQVYS